MFEKLIHADWSTTSAKKWMATAQCAAGGWHVCAPQRVPPISEFINDWLFCGGPVLAGFDFPIGLPAAFGRMTGFDDFLDALEHFGTGDWSNFYDVADRPDEISVRRPFYPQTYPKGRRQEDLCKALGVLTTDELRRVCERRTPERPAACPLFWTLGGNQVGKAAIDGWQSVIGPATLRGAQLWPVHGSLEDLSRSAGCVICETYPREAYSHVGVSFQPKGSKRSQQDRRRAATNVIPWAKKNGVTLSDAVRKNLIDGFGPSKSGEDPFDALIGLLSMIEVVDDRRRDGRPCAGSDTKWEGWIFGQCPTVFS
jgi:hypothetical protein